MSTTPDGPTQLIGFQHRAGYLLATLGRMAEAQWARALRGAGLTQTQFQVLVALSEAPQARQVDVAARIAVDPRNLVPVISRMVRDELIESAADSRDRRTRRLTLSGRGAAALERLNSAVAEGRIEFFTGLNEAEYGQLCRLLDKVYAEATGIG